MTTTDKKHMVSDKSQIYWLVVYDHKENVLKMGQFPLARGLDYEERVKRVHDIDKRAKALNLEIVRFGYYTIHSEANSSDFKIDDLPF